jgi:hypothetical protein
MGLSMVEMAIGKYPIPPPSDEELAAVFGDNAMEEHINAAKTGKRLLGKLSLRLSASCDFFAVSSVRNSCVKVNRQQGKDVEKLLVLLEISFLYLYNLRYLRP